MFGRELKLAEVNTSDQRYLVGISAGTQTLLYDFPQSFKKIMRQYLK
jgi:hypothetical protein